MKKIVGWREFGTLRPDVFHDSVALKGLMVKRVNSVRQREYCDGLVFDVEAEDAQGIVGRIFFFDAWAPAASFMAVGDEVSVDGVVSRALPSRVVTPSDVTTLASSSSAGSTAPPAVGQLQPADPAVILSTKRQIWCFAQAGENSILTVAQPAEQGDTIEFVVTSKNFEEPEARVRSKRPLKDTITNDETAGGLQPAKAAQQQQRVGAYSGRVMAE
jgi:hypothetical protein